MKISLILTSSRLILSPLVLAPLIAAHAPVWVPLTLYILLALTDFFDGYVARTYGQVSALGGFLDQFADKIFIFSCMFALVWTHQLWVAVAVLLAVRELAVMGMREYGMQHQITLPVIWSAKVKTAFQMVLFAWIILDVAGIWADAFTYSLVSITLFLSYYSAYQYARQSIVNDRISL